MTNNGWIALPRNIVAHWLWQDSRRFQMWIHLVFCAAWEDTCVYNGNAKIELKRGQFASSTRKLIKQWGCCTDTATSFLRILEKSNLITRHSEGRLTIITILDYDNYQPFFTDKSATSTVHNVEQHKQYNNKEEKIFLTFSRDNENQFFKQAITDNECLSSLCVLLCANNDTIIKELNIFLHEILVRKNSHHNFEEFITHFRNWYDKKLKKAAGAQSKNVNENSSDARRGTEISNKSTNRYKSETF